MPPAIDPAAALRETAYWLERQRADSHRPKAFRRAADSYDGLDGARRADLARRGAWAEVPGLGPKTVQVITQALAGRVPDYLASVRDDEPLTLDGAALRAAARGDLHVHTDASDGGAPLAEMIMVAAASGLEYVAITDHSPHLTVAHGLSAERLAEQGRAIDALGRDAGVRVLKGIEVDILEDGSLDQTAAALGGLDVVVASVHSKLRSDSETMTRRMVAAIANPATNVLGHCTGRLITGSRGTRPPSSFDAEVIFAACAQFGVAVEINSRPEREDPPDDLIALALDMGCHFAVDTDAHAPGQLAFLDYGYARADRCGVPAERIITTWEAERLLAFCRR